MENSKQFNRDFLQDVRPVYLHVRDKAAAADLEKKVKPLLRKIHSIRSSVNHGFVINKTKEKNIQSDPIWYGMPEHENITTPYYKTYTIQMKSTPDVNVLKSTLKLPLQNFSGDWEEKGHGGQNKGVKYPPRKIQKRTCKYICTKRLQPRYPVYVISKGRFDTLYTVRALNKIKVPFFLVIEPQEFTQYVKKVPKKNIITLPFKNLNQGSIPARNFVWEHSLKRGYTRHWILDDNIRDFYRYRKGQKLSVECGNIFRACEDFVDRYTNVALAGMQYQSFLIPKPHIKPYILNTRIYSCILIKNDLPMRWRGKYNEDTDLSLRALKGGYTTVMFNSFLIHKMKTMTMKGGNTEEVYKNGKRRHLFVKSLVHQHPDVVEQGQRYGRPHHVVNYRPYKDNKLKPVKGLKVRKGVNNYHMKLVKM